MTAPAVEDLLDALARAGLKRTVPRRAILEVLATIGRGASLDEIHARMRAKTSTAPDASMVGFSTVYRTMRTLVRLGLAREIRLADGVARYEIGKDEPLRAHFHCRACGLVEELPAARLAAFLPSARRAAKGRVERVRVEASGLCARCLADLPPERRRK